MHSIFKSLLLAIVVMVSLQVVVAAEDWTQWRGNNRDGVWTEKGIVKSFTADSLKVIWRQPIKSGYTGPTISQGRVFVMDRAVNPKQTERVICFDSATGKQLWVHEYDAVYRNVGYQAGPRASVTINDGLAYSLGSMGHVHCLDTITGNVVWSRDCNQEYGIVTKKRMPIWGIAASPIIYQDLVILHLGATDGASIVAFDKKTGKEVWRSLDDRAQYSAPIIHRQSGNDVLICWTGDHCVGINPKDGKAYWKHAIEPKNMPIGVATPIVKDDRIFLTSFYDGAHMLQMTPDMGIKHIWSQVGANERQTKGLHSMIGTPIWLGDYIYGVDSYGELRCLDAKTGQRVWSSEDAVPKSRWSTIHFVQNGDKEWLFNERGELILSDLSKDGFKEYCRAKLIDPTTSQLRRRGGVCWSHPGFADKCIFLRNDKEIICVSLAAD